MTRNLFLAAYRSELITRYEWALNVARLDSFMAAAESTISTARSTWNHDGDAVRAAWRAIGGKGRPTLKALRALA
jgi:hypothetical protein